MKLGILADIHEHTRELRKALAVLHEHGAERFVVLGDVFETGKRIEQTVRLLRQVEAVGVWGMAEIVSGFFWRARMKGRVSHRGLQRRGRGLGKNRERGRRQVSHEGLQRGRQ